MSEKNKDKKDKKDKKEKSQDLPEEQTINAWLNKLIFLILGGFLLYYIFFLSSGNPIQEQVISKQEQPKREVERRAR
jgi:hypothetical protein